MKYSKRKASEGTIGYRCFIARKNLGLSSTELSRITGIERTTIAKLETGVNKNIHASKACLIAKCLGVSTDWFVMGWE